MVPYQRNTNTRTITLKGFYLIDRVKEILSRHAFEHDARMSIDPLFFLTHFILHFTGDAKLFSLESIRRSVIASAGITISRSAFWERMASKRLGKMLYTTLAETTKLLSDRYGVNKQLMQSLGVNGLSFFDATIVTLRENARTTFDGTFTVSAIKFHLEMDGISGVLKWAILSSASVHDNCAFPDVKSLVGRLSIFDLGYYDWYRFQLMDQAGAFFLSRLKCNSTVRVNEIVSGFGRKHRGKRLSDITIKKCRGEIVEFHTLRKIKGESAKFRVIGFWNAEAKKYHWYMTNLTCGASLIAPLYRMRWQIELLIKASKQSLNLNQIPSGNEKIVIHLCVARMIALTLSMVIRRIGLMNTKKSSHEGISVIRSTKVLALLSNDIKNYVVDTFVTSRKLLRERIAALLNELFDPNANRRKTSIGKVVSAAYDSPSQVN